MRCVSEKALLRSHSSWSPRWQQRADCLMARS